VPVVISVASFTVPLGAFEGFTTTTAPLAVLKPEVAQAV
jgi:hypothetical protein